MHLEAATRPRLLDDRNARAWLGLALGVLVVAGVLALLLVLGRMPPFDRLVEDPQFFRRCLVVHVNLALVLWFDSFIAVLLFRLPPRPRSELLSRISVWLGVVGLLLLTAAAWLPGTSPVMSNYVPMIDHWLFGLGQACFASGVAAVALGRRWLPSRDGDTGVETGLRSCILGLAIALITLAATWTMIPGRLSPSAYYELLFWGCGHVLQLVSAVALITVWLILARSMDGFARVGTRWCVVLFALLVLPWLISPLLPLAGVWTATYKTGFTRLMQFGMLPVLVFLVLLAPSLRGSRWTRDARASGMAASMLLMLAGMGLGALIRDANTVIPAHYHAAIGAVTVSFMAVAYHLLGVSRQGRAGWHPVIYGAGQLTFAVGFGVAGAFGMARKVYGAEQAARGLGETIGLVVMGVGGIAAVAGGVVFLFVACRALRAWRPESQRTSQGNLPRNIPWTHQSTQSRS